MRIRFIWVGKTKNKHIAALTDEYLKRLGRFASVEVTVVKEHKAASEAAATRIIEAESEAIKRALGRDSFPVLLDIAGQSVSSPGLAEFIAARQQDGTKELAFIIGGFLGVNAHLKDSARWRMSLSRLTLTHELARVLLSEQVYRAFTILQGLPYQK